MEDHKNYQNVSTTSQFHDTSVNLICHYQFENGSSQFIFLDVENENKPFLDHSLCFCTETFVQTIASCNGLILLSGYSGDQSCYYVFNTLTKHSTKIPQPHTDRRVFRVGLASDGCQFDVVVLIEADSSNSNGLEFHIFSCDTEEWRVHHQNNLTLPSLLKVEFQELAIPPLYSNGAIHWEIGGYLLVYKVQENHCELFELPNFDEDCYWQSTTITYRGCLSESRGRVYYCYTDFDGLHIWDLLNENDGDFELLHGHGSFDSKRFRWRLFHSIKHEEFVFEHQTFCGKITPIAYSEQAQIIYLQLPGTVVSYNFGTGDFGSICTYSDQGSDVNCCSFFSSTTSGLHYRHRGKDLLTNGEMELNLPLSHLLQRSPPPSSSTGTAKSQSVIFPFVVKLSILYASFSSF